MLSTAIGVPTVFPAKKIMENINGDSKRDAVNENHPSVNGQRSNIFDGLEKYRAGGLNAIIKVEDTSSGDIVESDRGVPSRRSAGPNQTNSALVQRNLELHLSKDAQARIQEILDDVTKLSDKEKLLLYLKLPTKTGMQDCDGQPIPLSNTRQEQTQAFQWIRSHLEECDSSCTLPKHEVYDDYKIYCEGLASSRTLSAPDFGKIIKCVFPKVKARRLGTRGNSKYCYSGLRKKISKISPSLPSIRPDDKNGEVNNNTEDQASDISEDQTLSAACVLVCEWANKLLGRVFTTLIELARFLVGGSYVSTKSMAAFVVMAATESKVQKMNSKLTFNPTAAANGSNRVTQGDATGSMYASPVKGLPQLLSCTNRTPTPQESQIVPKTPKSLRKERGQNVAVVEAAPKVRNELLMSPPPGIPPGISPGIPSHATIPPITRRVVAIDASTPALPQQHSPGTPIHQKPVGTMGVVYMVPNAEHPAVSEGISSAQVPLQANPVTVNPVTASPVKASYNQNLAQQTLASPRRTSVPNPQRQLKILYPTPPTKLTQSPTANPLQQSQIVLHEQQQQTGIRTRPVATETVVLPTQPLPQEKQAPSTPSHRQTHVSRTPPMRRSDSCPYPPISPRNTTQEVTAPQFIQSPLYINSNHGQLSPQPQTSPHSNAGRRWPANQRNTTSPLPCTTAKTSVFPNHVTSPYKTPVLQRCNSVPAPTSSLVNNGHQTLTPNPSSGPRVIYSPARCDPLRDGRAKMGSLEGSRARRNLTAVLEGGAPLSYMRTEQLTQAISRNHGSAVEPLIDVPFSLETEFTGNPSELNDLDGLDDIETVELLKSLEGGEHIWSNEWPSAALPIMETS